MKQQTLIRDRVLSLTVEMLRRLHSYVSALPQFEEQVLLRLESPAQFDTATLVANSIMASLGDAPSAVAPRFNKTRRALAKKIPKASKAKFSKAPAPADFQAPEAP